MLPLSWKSLLYTAVRIGLAAAFLVAGVLKISDPMTFAVTVDAFGILPAPLVMPVAVILPAVEILGAAALIFDIRGSLALITLMILVFMAVLGWGLHMGLDIDCGCYGPGDPEAEAYAGIRGALHRDLLLFACVVFLYSFRKILGVRPRSISRRLQSAKTFIHKEENA
jgi:uncharacterized membrane protein YphA (DoxX/SURF4 family)